MACATWLPGLALGLALLARSRYRLDSGTMPSARLICPGPAAIVIPQPARSSSACYQEFPTQGDIPFTSLALPKQYAWLGKAGGRMLDMGPEKAALLAIDAITNI